MSDFFQLTFLVYVLSLFISVCFESETKYTFILHKIAPNVTKNLYDTQRFIKILLKTDLRILFNRSDANHIFDKISVVAKNRKLVFDKIKYFFFMLFGV